MSVTVTCNCGEALSVVSEDIGIHNQEIEIELQVEPCPKCLAEQYDLGEITGHIMGRDEAMEEAFDSVNKLVEKALNEHS